MVGFKDLGFVIPSRVKVKAVALLPPSYYAEKPEFTLSSNPDKAHEIELINPLVFEQLEAVVPEFGISISSDRLTVSLLLA